MFPSVLFSLIRRSPPRGEVVSGKLAVAMIAGALVGGCGPAPDSSSDLSTDGGSPGEPGRLGPLEGAAAWQGVLPCADCAGIRTTLTLRPDGTYRRHDAYLGRAPETDTVFASLGRWTAEGEGERIVLRGSDEGPTFLSALADGGLRMLDRAGEPIVSEMNYTLGRLGEPGEIGGPTRLVAAYTYMADAALVVECTSGIQLPVAMADGYLELERLYTAGDQAPGDPLVVHLRGRVEERPAMEGDGLETSFVVDTVGEVGDGTGCPALEVKEALASGEWRLQTLDGAPVQPTPPGEVPTLSWDPDEVRVTGTSGCNRYTARGFLRGTLLLVEAAAVTRRFCEGVMDLEGRFLEILTGGGVLRLEGNELVLSLGPEEVATFVRG